jgi:hypothetical protein
MTRFRRDSTREFWNAEQRFDFRCEIQATALLVDKQRLLAEPVPCQEQGFPARIPNREREHASQMMNHVVSPVLVRAQQDLGVGITREAVPAAGENPPQFAKVVDFAVEGEGHACDGIAHRLMSAARVDDCEPAMSENHFVAAAREVAAYALVIRSPMRDGVEHRGKQTLLRRGAFRRDPSRNAAHHAPRSPARATLSSDTAEVQVSVAARRQ